MSHIQFVDVVVREYLLFRGFSTTLKSYDNELKSDKDRGFRVDKIIEQINHYVNVSDLQSLKDLWSHLDSLLFSKLDQHFTPAIRKLEYGVLRYYLVTAVTNNKPDKVTEFFTKLAPELQTQSEWKDWFMLPFIKNPEDNPVFSVCFTKQWQDTLLVSLHNLLATIFQCMPQPTLSGIEAEAPLVKKLQEENAILRSRLSQTLQNSPQSNFPSSSHQSRAATFQDYKSESKHSRSPKPFLNIGDINPVEVTPPPHIVDDFYIIAQENLSGNTNYYSDNGISQARSFKSLIRNIGGTGSPVMGRKDTMTDRNKKRSGSVGSRSWTHN